ncbi:hypothetical protein FRX31_031119, partial [Thalictrum thalictroides]
MESVHHVIAVVVVVVNRPTTTACIDKVLLALASTIDDFQNRTDLLSQLVLWSAQGLKLLVSVIK